MIMLCKCGEEIAGTFERLTARCSVQFSKTSEGVIAWEHDGGHTELFYDDMKTETRDGEVVFLCYGGCESKLSELMEEEPE